jgi:hypothetical protein
MFFRTAVTVTLFTSLLGATDIFSVRSFRDPETKAKIPVIAQLFTTSDQLDLLAQGAATQKTEKCAIPLQQAKPGKIHDNMAQFAGPSHDSASIMPPPLPACKNWK